MVPPEVTTALKSMKAMRINGEKVDSFQCGVLMFITRFGAMPFIKAESTDENYKLIQEGKFAQKITEFFRNGKDSELDLKFVELVVQMLHHNPEVRPTMKELLANSLFDSNQ